MKYIYSILISFAIAASAHAQTLNLFIENSTGSTLVAEKADGVKITVAGNAKVENIPFEKNSQVKSFVDGKLKCTWIVTEEGMPSQWKLVGLYYDVYGSEPFCGRIAQDENNQNNKIK